MTQVSATSAPRKCRLTPATLFEYARDFAKESEANDRGTQFPTFRQAATHFRTTLSKIEEACEDYVGDGYMKPAVAFRTFSGYGSYERKGDWLVEAYDA